jgi:hypothetical protein
MIDWALRAPAGTESRIAMNHQERTEPKLGSQTKMWSHPRWPAAQVLTDVVTSGLPAGGRGEMWSHLASKSSHAPGRPVWRGLDEVCRHSGSQSSPLSAREGRREGEVTVLTDYGKPIAIISTIEQATKAESRSDAGEFREALLSLPYHLDLGF